MAYKSEKEHELKLKVNVSKGSKVQNKEVKIPVTYKFPSDEEGLVTNNGQYDIAVTNDDGSETIIGNGGNVANNGTVQILDNDKLLEVAQKSNKDVTESNLNAAMANGGTADLQKTGIQKRNDNLSPKNQQDLANKNNLSQQQAESQGLNKAQDTKTTDNDKSDNNNQEPKTTDADDSQSNDSEQSGGINFKGASLDYGTMQYPEELDKLLQDYIKFRTYRYLPQVFKSDASTGFEYPELGSPEGTVYLPIQSAEDGNSVSWGSNEVDAGRAFAYRAAYELIDGGRKATNTLEAGFNDLKTMGAEARKFVTLQAAQKAAGVTNMLSRTSGAILNPNMTLLFNKPELRNFNYTFTFRARKSSEASMIRRIIRMFKQSMSVRRESTNLFLMAPNVFKISYHRGGISGEDHTHQAIGRPKVVALKSCNVNYMPDGSYMTFNDPAGTMTAYQMTLSFTELDPVYYEEYEEFKADEIGL